MKIRAEQMNALGETMQQRFEKRAMARLRDRFGAQLARTTDDDLRARVRAGVERAASYGIEAEFDLLRYLEYCEEYGPNFDTASAWAPPILQAESSGTSKMDELDNWTTFSLRR